MKKTTLTFFFWLLLWAESMGQSLYNNGSVISIGPGTIFSVQDSLVNNGTLTNNGNMVMGGVWLNLGTYNPGTGEITFNSPTGSDPQIINHNSQSFSKLTISGGGEKLILADMTIVGELVLNDGVITYDNDASVRFDHGALITGGSDQSHIYARVVQLGTGDKLFPVGNGTLYLPVEIFGIGSASEVGVMLVELATPLTFDKKPELSDVSDKRYWALALVNGSLDGTQISLPVKGDEGLSAATTEFVVVQSSNSPVEFESLGQSNFTGTSTDGIVVSNDAVSGNVVSIGILSEGISVYNAVSANDDDEINAVLKISNLKVPNLVSIFNRWGDKVFEMKDYDHNDPLKVFRGDSNVGKEEELPPGTYFYSIDRKDGSPIVNGFLSLKR